MLGYQAPLLLHNVHISNTSMCGVLHAAASTKAGSQIQRGSAQTHPGLNETFPQRALQLPRPLSPALRQAPDRGHPRWQTPLLRQYSRVGSFGAAP